MKRRAFLAAAAALAVSPGVLADPAPLRVLCWSEGTAPKKIYPHEICGAVAAAIQEGPECVVRTATLADAEQGLSDAALAGTDVLFWWGHQKHQDVRDDRVAAILKRVREGGMGFVALHSAHYSKPFKRLLKAGGNLGGVGMDSPVEHISIKALGHPIVRMVQYEFDIPHEEWYSEPFDVPEPETVVLESTWDNGRRFRSGCCWIADRGRIFYFRPGHEEFPTYFHHQVMKILLNAARWAARR